MSEQTYYRWKKQYGGLASVGDQAAEILLPLKNRATNSTRVEETARW